LIETRLWTGDVDGELRPGEAGTLPRFSADGSRRALTSLNAHLAPQLANVEWPAGGGS
jgi:hypothetical protein